MFDSASTQPSSILFVAGLTLHFAGHMTLLASLLGSTLLHHEAADSLDVLEDVLSLNHSTPQTSPVYALTTHTSPTHVHTLESLSLVNCGTSIHVHIDQ